MNGIRALLDGEGFNNLEVWLPQMKFDNTMPTGSRWWNEFYNGAFSSGLSHGAILTKLRAGSLLGDAAKARQLYYIKLNPSGFKIKVNKQTKHETEM